MASFLVTGSAGFIGFHLSKKLLSDGHTVHGVDAITDYYDVQLKLDRNRILEEDPAFSLTKCRLEDMDNLLKCADMAVPDVIVHLGAQAGVRYSLENPRAYIDTNVVGTFNIMEVARIHNIKHLLMASTSSAYGANPRLPYKETDNTDTPLTIYAASKKANEVMAHSYSHLWNLPTTMFRFFTVYGPWGRPDMALFKFTKNILSGEPIDVYNRGNMFRDFTYVEDLATAVAHLIDVPPNSPAQRSNPIDDDSLSPVAPYRIVNIGNSDKIRLMDFIEELEIRLGKKAIYNFMDIQAGDVPTTWASNELLKSLTGFCPTTSYGEGIDAFVSWYQSYYT